MRTWLFIRGAESIWIERLRTPSLIIAGPGSERERRDFIDDATLDDFQVELVDKLAAQGWFLWAFDRDRRSGTDRRTVSREAPERRHAIKRV